MTLALLLTVVTGAWATDPNTVIWNGNETTWKGWTDSETTHTVGDITITCSGNAKAYEHKYYSGRPLVMEATTGAITFTSNGAPFTSIKIKMYGNTDPGLAGWTWDNGHNIEWSGTPSTSVTLNGCDFAADMITFTFAAAEPPIEVAWDPATKTGTFAMPGSDVVLTPQYAPAAKWDVVENVEQLPAALEGIIAGQDAAIVTAGQSAQGTVMYAVTTSAEAAPALTAFSATVPTAKDYDDATTLYVWYYIQGADTPDGQEATAENTFNDSEICTTPLTVQVLTNKFDIQFNAANANTIEAGKATVTVGGTDKTVTEGKLQGVKMGSEVKVKANTGYKFRKVEVKKKAAAKPLANATTEDLGKVVGADGNIYANKAAAEAANTTAVAMICYVNEGHGLALALSDEGDMDWNTALTTCAAHTPAVTGATWKLASKSEMNLMINAAGNYAALRDGFSAVGGTNMIDEYYWLSDESSADYAENFNFSYGSWSQEFKDCNYKVRACLAF